MDPGELFNQNGTKSSIRFISLFWPIPPAELSHFCLWDFTMCGMTAKFVCRIMVNRFDTINSCCALDICDILDKHTISANYFLPHYD